MQGLIQHWKLIGWVGLSVGVMGFGWGFMRAGYIVNSKLISNQAPAFLTSARDAAPTPTRAPGMPTLLNLIRSNELLRHLAATSDLHWSPSQLANHSAATVVPGTDIIALSVQGPTVEQTVRFANAYAEEVVRLTRQLQCSEIHDISRSLKDQISEVDQALEQANNQLIEFQRSAGWVDFEKETSAHVQQRVEWDQKAENLRIQVETLDLQIKNLLVEIARQSPNLVATKAALEQALTRYTEEHPKVKELRAALVVLENQGLQKGTLLGPEVAARDSAVASSLYTHVIDLRTQKTALAKQGEEINVLRGRLQEQLRSLPEKQWQYGKLKAEAASLRSRREMLMSREQEARMLEENATGYCRIFEPARAEDISRFQKLEAGAGLGLLAGLIGAAVAAVLVLISEFFDPRIRSKEDLRRAARLPIIAVLGEIDKMSQAEQEQWAFRTLLVLKRHLTQTRREALVCGFVSATHGEGRSTWIRLLADAAGRQGYRVLAISAHPFATPPASPDTASEPSRDPWSLSPLAAPSELVREILAPNSSPILHVPLPGWVWSLEHREHWQRALEQWRALDNLLVLVELPPAAEPESILLAESVPNLIWVCSKDMATSPETRAHLETLRHARSNVVAGVFNRAPTPAARRKGQSRAPLAALALLALGMVVRAGETNAPPTAQAPAPETAASFAAPSQATPPSVQGPAGDAFTNAPVAAAGIVLADWQRRLTLGPGDMLSLSLYDQADSGRQLAIGPDGRLNYLQVQDFPAAGLTVD